MSVLDTCIKAWEQGVASDYEAGSVVSERSLQASLYFHIRTLMPSFPLYVEPKVKYHGASPKRIPDLVISDGNEAVALVELKFFPWWSPVGKDIFPDVSRLAEFRSLQPTEKLYLEIDPGTGEFDVRNRISSSAAYVFGIVGQDVRSALTKYCPWRQATAELRPELYILFGDIAGGETPDWEFGCIRPEAALDELERPGE